MDNEKKFILGNRYISLGVMILCILLAIICFITQSFSSMKPAEIVDDDGYINYYSDYSNTTSVEITVTFDCPVDSGYITVAFYDANELFLEQKTSYFYGDYVNEETLSATFFVNGNVEYYEIISHEITASNNAGNNETLRDLSIAFIICAVLSLTYFLCTFQLSYKKYDYCGNVIIVYSGFYDHYITVNGRRFDEHKTLITYSPIVLSCTFDDGAVFTATISIFGRITLKLNNNLYTNEIK